MMLNKNDKAEKYLKEAKSSLYQLNLSESIRLTEEAINNDKGLTEAYRYLSHLLFYFEKDYSRAHEIIDKAIETSNNEYQSYGIKGDIYYDEKKFNEAIECYKKALEQLTSLDSELLAKIGDCYLNLDDNKECRNYYEKAIEVDPLCIQAIRKLRVICVKNGDYMKAFELWKMDNLIDDEEKVVGTIEQNYKNIRTVTKDIIANDLDCVKLIQLGDSYYKASLYEDALIVYQKIVEMESTQSDVQNRIIIIQDFLKIIEEFKVTITKIYNSIIHGEKRNIKNHQQMLYSILLKLSQHFKELNKLPDKLNKKSWKKICKFYLKEFNLHINNFFAKNHLYGTYTAFVVNTQNLCVNYWNKKGKLQCIELGIDIDQTYTTWAWEYFKSGTGGWVSPNMKNTIYYVSDRYKSINRNWKAITDKGISKIWKEAANKDLSYDLYPVDKVFYSEGLNYRFKLKFINKIYDEAINKFDCESDQIKYFYSRFYKSIYQVSIVSHEGQHTIDLKNILSMIKIGIYAWVKHVGGISSALEYKAKLTELHYGKVPFYSLHALMSQDINSPSPHGKANTLIFKRMVNYIQNNSHEFSQIDVSKNILLQLDKLELNQIRMISKSIFK
ncbi:hypothetical protein KHQ81_12340 [Mycoplasmatota bacterium]|nr:hypothetical protein KHQ81_12340 [Mycoplasmatota bacterium]